MAKKKEEFPGQFAAEEKSKLIRQKMELIEKTITEIIDAGYKQWLLPERGGRYVRENSILDLLFIKDNFNYEDTQYLLKTMSKAILASINSNSVRLANEQKQKQK